jgi:hypothetical protein
LESSAHEVFQFFIQPFIDRADAGGAEFLATQLLGNGLDLAGADSLNVHLRQRCHQGLLAALVALEKLRAKAALPILWHS